jgi:SPP1 family predicted phage head-tail adaptor
MIDPGQYQKEADIIEITSTPNNYGAGGDKTESVFLSGIRCYFEPLTDEELKVASRVERDATHMFESYFYDGVKSYMLLRVDGVDYDIISMTKKRTGNVYRLQMKVRGYNED